MVMDRKMKAAFDEWQELFRMKKSYRPGAIDGAEWVLEYLRSQQEPVAKVRVHRTGGNAGIAWSAVAINDYDSLPLLNDGTLLYTKEPK